MKKLMLVIAIFSILVIPTYADTYAYIRESEKNTNGLSSYTPSVNLTLDMSEIISYDIGFSSNTNASNPSVRSSTTIVPEVNYDNFTISGSDSSYYYIYYNIVSNKKLTFDLQINGPLTNGNDGKGIEWEVEVGNNEKIISSNGNTTYENFMSYTLPSGRLGATDTKSIHVSIPEQSLDGLVLGTYSGTLSLIVTVDG